MERTIISAKQYGRRATAIMNFAKKVSENKEGHIYVFGPIGEGGAGMQFENSVTPKDIQEQVNALKDVEKIIVHIHSEGGSVDDGFAIHDILKNSGKEIETRIEGVCASIATIVALAGKVRSMTSTSELMIHNPFGGVQGEAKEVADYAERLKLVEQKIADFYVEMIPTIKKDIDDLMKEETRFDAKKAKELGFITDIVENIKSVAVLGNGEEGEDNEMVKQFKALSKKVMSGLGLDENGKKKKKIENRTYTLDDGRKIETDVEEQIAVGQGVTMVETGDVLADGDYNLEDGRVVVVADGAVTEVKETDDPEGDDDEAMKALKEKNERLIKQNTELQTKNAELKTSQEETDKKVEEITKNMETFAASIGTKYEPGGRMVAVTTKKKEELEEGNRIQEGNEKRTEKKGDDK